MELFGMMEPDVTLTDYGITVLCLVTIWLIWRGPRFGQVRSWLLLFYAGVGLAAALGGTVHGFFDLAGTPEYDLLWPASLISIGLAAFGAWGIGARLAFREAIGSGVIGLAGFVFLIYCGIVIGGSQSFAVAIIHYLPAALFLFASIVIANHRDPHPGLKVAGLGLLLTFAAAAIQQQRVALHDVYFDHNALYHLVQAVALVLIYRGLTRALRP